MTPKKNRILWGNWAKPTESRLIRALWVSKRIRFCESIGQNPLNRDWFELFSFSMDTALVNRMCSDSCPKLKRLHNKSYSFSDSLGKTESVITELVITELGITELGKTESGITESVITELCITELGIMELGIRQSGVMFFPVLSYTQFLYTWYHYTPFHLHIIPDSWIKFPCHTLFHYSSFHYNTFHFFVIPESIIPDSVISITSFLCCTQFHYAWFCYTRVYYDRFPILCCHCAIA